MDSTWKSTVWHVIAGPSPIKNVIDNTRRAASSPPIWDVCLHNSANAARSTGAEKLLFNLNQISPQNITSILFSWDTAGDNVS